MRLAAFAFAALFAAAGADAATITVLANGSITPGARALAAAFTRETGTEVTFVGGRPDKLVADLKAGAPGDVVLLPSASFAGGIPRLVPGSQIGLARIAIGVAVPLGASLPDISTPEKFRAALKTAKGVSYSDPAIGSAAGPVIDAILRRPEYAGVKTVPVKDVAISAFADGKADIALQMITELTAAKTVQLAGPVPDGVGAAVDFSAGLLSGAPDEARAFIAYVTRPEAGAAWRAAGATPVR